MQGIITGGKVLREDSAEPVDASLSWHGSQITAIGDSASNDAEITIDATDCLVLPGIVDLHGDAFERAVMPRGGVSLDLDIAMGENDGQLLTNGITTSMLSATDSWEPGLRSRETLRTLIAALDRRSNAPRVLLHVRHERCNTDDLDELLGWIETGTIQVISYNDHTPGGNEHITGITPSQLGRAGVDEPTLRQLLEAAIDRRPTGLEQERAIASAAAHAEIATASHDPASDADLQRDLSLGIAFAEFPLSIDLALKYRKAGIPVLLGAPNLVRGGSHLGNLAVADAVAVGAADILCSDYHYPSVLQAPFRCVEQGLAPLADAWAMVSGSAATAAGLHDRGTLAPGKLADVIVVEPPTVGPARVRAVVVDGQPALVQQPCMS